MRNITEMRLYHEQDKAEFGITSSTIETERELIIQRYENYMYGYINHYNYRSFH